MRVTGEQFPRDPVDPRDPDLCVFAVCAIVCAPLILLYAVGHGLTWLFGDRRARRTAAN